MIAAHNIHYELGDRVQGLGPGGIGAMLLLARRTGLIADIDHYLHLFKYHRPYHEFDHVLNVALNILAGGTKLQHIERLRNDEAYLNALVMQKRIPDPTTTGDFCRRFRRCDVLDLMDAINRTRKRVWPQQPVDFFLTRLSSTSTAPLSAPTPSAKRASISPTTAPGAIIPCWSAGQHQGAAVRPPARSCSLAPEETLGNSVWCSPQRAIRS